MIVCVGHTKNKFLNLLSLVGDKEKFCVYNGLGAVPADVFLANDRLSRDIGMYSVAMDMLPVDRAVFINDDILHLSEGWWRMVEAFLADKNPPDIIGVANLASWCDHEKLSGWQKHLAEQQGKQPIFIRTSAFMCTRNWFNHLLSLWEGDAQKFEKATLKGASRVVLLSPEDAYDSNTEPYIPTKARGHIQSCQQGNTA